MIFSKTNHVLLYYLQVVFKQSVRETCALILLFFFFLLLFELS